MAISDKQKVVFLIRNVAPYKYGGGETYQIKLAELLGKNGFKVYIITASKGLIEEATRKNLKIIESPYIDRQNWSGFRNLLFPKYFVNILRLRSWYKKILDKYKPDVINVQSRDDWIAVTCVAKKRMIKVLWTDHMDFRSWVLTNINVWYKNLIGKWVLKCAKDVDKIILISDFESEYFRKIVLPRKFANIETIKNGTIDEFENYKSIKKEKNSFCYIGRIVEYKGIRELIEAFEIVNTKYPDSQLNIYGEGEDFEKYRDLPKNGRIFFHGKTAHPLKALAKNDIFVLPSYREGLSLSLLDAAMMGKKIIATNIDGNPEVVLNKKTGILVPVKKADKLAEAMVYMIEDKDHPEKMSKEARKMFKENYDFEKIFEEKMLPLYNNVKEKE